MAVYENENGRPPITKFRWLGRGPPKNPAPATGIKNPAVDAMIDQIVFAKNRADLEAAARALDRILLWNPYVVPQ